MAVSAIQMKRQEELKKLLKVPAGHKHEQAILLQRVAALGLGEPCSRCGGTGNHSFNLMYGTICFKCAGNKVFLPRTLTAELLDRARQEVEAGKIESYLEAIRTFQRADKAVDMVMAVWSANSPDYKWTDCLASVRDPEALRLAAINEPMHAAYQRTEDAATALRAVAKGTLEERTEAARNLNAVAEEAIRIIKDAAKLI